VSDPEPDPDTFERLAESQRDVLHYSRARFLATWFCVGLLAVMTGLSLIAATRNARTDLEQTDEIARVASTTADAANKQADQTTAYLKGDTGIPGVPGANGTDGTPGLPSSEPGPKGEPGPAGDPGAAGSQGPAGPQGAFGAVGAVGLAGPPGAAGETGAQGAKGEKGDEGARGAEGPRGEAGPPGPAGPPGVTPPINTAIAVGASANDTAAHKSVQATCASGRATGGGFATVPSDPGIDVSASSPVSTNGWNATADVLSLPPGTTWQLLVFVVCVS
jgi:hypothetical protein